MNRCASINSLTTKLNLSPEVAKKIRKLASLRDDAKGLREYIAQGFPTTHARAVACYHDPFNSRMWRTTMVLDAINEVIGGHGVEGFGPRDNYYAPLIEHINFGDPYVLTIVYNRKTDSLNIGCWGDIAERHPSWS